MDFKGDAQSPAYRTEDCNEIVHARVTFLRRHPVQALARTVGLGRQFLEADRGIDEIEQGQPCSIPHAWSRPASATASPATGPRASCSPASVPPPSAALPCPPMAARPSPSAATLGPRGIPPPHGPFPCWPLCSGTTFYSRRCPMLLLPMILWLLFQKTAPGTGGVHRRGAHPGSHCASNGSQGRERSGGPGCDSARVVVCRGRPKARARPTLPGRGQDKQKPPRQSAATDHDRLQYRQHMASNTRLAGSNQPCDRYAALKLPAWSIWQPSDSGSNSSTPPRLLTGAGRSHRFGDALCDDFEWNGMKLCQSARG